MTTAVEILTHAATLVGGDRAKSHGPKDVNHIAIAELWNAYLRNAGVIISNDMGGSQHLNAHDVAQMMVLLKIARTQSGGVHNPDNYVDGAGYMAIAGELADADQ